MSPVPTALVLTAAALLLVACAVAARDGLWGRAGACLAVGLFAWLLPTLWNAWSAAWH